MSDKWTYITKISQLGDENGNLLIKLMDKYDVIGLYQITYQQAKDFYDELINCMNERK